MSVGNVIFDFFKICQGVKFVLFVQIVTDVLGVDELASVTVRTSSLLQKLSAKLGLVPGRDVLLLLELMLSMSEGALVVVRT